MMLYDADSLAPRCLRMFLLEKGLKIPSVNVDVFAGENRRKPFTDLNPAGQTPVLALTAGPVLAESVAIAEYLEELYPEPSLIGATPVERALTRQWWRRVELNITEFIHNAYHYAEGLARFRDRIPIVPEAADGLKRVARDRLAWLDGMMSADPYLCGERLSAADIWLYIWLDFGAAVGQPFDRTLPRIAPWFDRIAYRKSAEASRLTFTQAEAVCANPQQFEYEASRIRGGHQIEKTVDPDQGPRGAGHYLLSTRMPASRPHRQHGRGLAMEIGSCQSVPPSPLKT